MLWTLSEECAKVLKWLKEPLEKENRAGLEIVSAALWTLPVEQIEVAYRLSQGREPDLVESMILQTLNSGLHRPVTESFLAQLLGLDPVFIRTSLRPMEKSKILQERSDGGYELTSLGADFARAKKLPGELREGRITFYYERKGGRVYTRLQQGEAAPYEKLDQLRRTLPDQKHFISRDLLQKVAQAKHQTIQEMEKGRLITSLRGSRVIGEGETLYAQIWFYDVAAGKLICRVWDYATADFYPPLERFAMEHTAADEVLREPYHQLLSHRYKTQAFSPYYLPAKQEYMAARENNVPKGKAEETQACGVLDPGQAEEWVRLALQGAREQVWLVLPRLWEQALGGPLGQEISRLVSQGVKVEVVYRESETEGAREMARELLAPGELHQREDVTEKELMVDDALLLQGSLNWFSYYGPYDAYEPVFFVKDPEKIRRARQRLQEEEPQKAL